MSRSRECKSSRRPESLTTGETAAFTDAEAGQPYRREQARRLLRNLVVSELSSGGDKGRVVPAFSETTAGSFSPTEAALEAAALIHDVLEIERHPDKDQLNELIRRARR